MEFGFYQLLHIALSSFGVLINVFLLFLAVRKSPKLMRPCSALITNKALTDIFSSLASAFVMQRILTDGESVTIIPTGPCIHIGKVACYAGHMLMISFLEHNMIWLLACYIFRYYILYFRDPKIKSIVLAAFLVYTPSFLHTAGWVNSYAEDDDQQFYNQSQFYPFLTCNDMIISGPVVYWSSIVVFTQLVLTATLVIFAYIWIRKVIINYILDMGAIIDSDVKTLNKQLVKILTFQVCIPIWIFLGVIFFLFMYFDASNPQFLQYAVTVSFMLAPVISPFSYILFVPHYWNYCIGKEGIKPGKNSSVSTFSSSFNDATANKYTTG